MEVNPLVSAQLRYAEVAVRLHKIEMILRAYYAHENMDSAMEAMTKINRVIVAAKALD